MWLHIYDTMHTIFMFGNCWNLSAGTRAKEESNCWVLQYFIRMKMALIV